VTLVRKIIPSIADSEAKSLSSPDNNIHFTPFKTTNSTLVERQTIPNCDTLRIRNQLEDMMKKLILFIIVVFFSLGLYAPSTEVSAAPNAYIYADVIVYQNGLISVLVTYGNQSGDTIPRASVQCLYTSNLGSASVAVDTNQDMGLLKPTFINTIGSYTSVEFGFNSITRSIYPTTLYLPAGIERQVGFIILSRADISGTIQCSLMGYANGGLYGVTSTAVIPVDTFEAV
jgi:hypothetical protein